VKNGLKIFGDCTGLRRPPLAVLGRAEQVSVLTNDTTMNVRFQGQPLWRPILCQK